MEGPCDNRQDDEDTTNNNNAKQQQQGQQQPQKQQKETRRPIKVTIVKKKKPKRKIILGSKQKSLASSSVVSVVPKNNNKNYHKKKIGGGLPSYLQLRQRPQQHQQSTMSLHAQHKDDDEEEEEDKEHNTLSWNEAMMAIESLIQEDAGLAIPLLVGNGSMVQVVLESQIFQRFQQEYASATQGYLTELYQSNQIRKLYATSSFTTTTPSSSSASSSLFKTHTQNRGSSSSSSFQTTTTTNTIPVIIKTNDYVTGVWDAHNHHERSMRNNDNNNNDHNTWDDVISWFLSNLLSVWTTQSILSLTEMEAYWERDISLQSKQQQQQQHPSPNRKTPQTTTVLTTSTASTATTAITLDRAIQYLLKIQVLMRATHFATTSLTKNHNKDGCYQLWLPQWGLVQKSWNEARQKLLGYIARSPKGEASEQNVLRENRHAAVSTRFLLDELIHQGQLLVVRRPFGKFIQRRK